MNIPPKFTATKKEQRPPTSRTNVMLKIRLCQKNRPSAKHKSLYVSKLNITIEVSQNDTL